MKDAFPWMKRARFSLLALIAVATLLVSGCGGSDSYTEPLQTRTETPLVEPHTLKTWMDQGLINANEFEKVVIMQVEPEASKLRIPGAFRITTSDITLARVEGLAEHGSMVASGAQMDQLIQRLGIDGNTTIVFTTGDGSPLYYPTRAYFVFRYWGFPKERLKVLNGGNAGWKVAAEENVWGESYALTDQAPTPIPSTFSVRKLGALRDDLRVSLSEMITEVVPGIGTTAMTIDARGEANWAGTSPTSALRDTGKVVAFQGHPAGGKALAAMSQFVVGGRYIDGDIALALLDTIDWQPGMKVTTYCTSGFSCTPIFFVLDALTTVPVQVYDGSWSQWGQYASNEIDLVNNTTGVAPADGLDDQTGGALPLFALGDVRDAWDTSQYTSSRQGGAIVDAPIYNAETAPGLNNARALISIQNLAPNMTVLFGTNGPADPSANQIENEDREYMQTPPAGGAAGPVSGGSGGGC